MRKINKPYYTNPELSRAIGHAKVDALIDNGVKPGELIEALTPVIKDMLPDTRKKNAAMVAKLWVELRPPIYTFSFKDKILHTIKTLKP